VAEIGIGVGVLFEHCEERRDRGAIFETAKADRGEGADAWFGIAKERDETGTGLLDCGFAEHFGGLGANFGSGVARGDQERELGVGAAFARALAESLPDLPRSLKEAGVVPTGHLNEICGLKGLRVGNAQVSEKHCNFLLNLGGATSADIEALGEEVRDIVRDHSGITLRWEIERVGVRS